MGEFSRWYDETIRPDKGTVHVNVPKTWGSHFIPDESERSKALDEAKALINGDRQEDYGTPEVNFTRIAEIWNVLFPERDWIPADIALAMAAVKVARAAQGYTRDTYVDLAGYAALAVELNEMEDE